MIHTGPIHFTEGFCADCRQDCRDPCGKNPPKDYASLIDAILDGEDYDCDMCKKPVNAKTVHELNPACTVYSDNCISDVFCSIECHDAHSALMIKKDEDFKSFRKHIDAVWPNFVRINFDSRSHDEYSIAYIEIKKGHNIIAQSDGEIMLFVNNKKVSPGAYAARWRKELGISIEI
jgi:hypothetical protein